jgi:hypothetical protein
MKLFLAYLLAMVVLGLVTERLSARVYGLVLLAAVITTALFYELERFWV